MPDAPLTIPSEMQDKVTTSDIERPVPYDTPDALFGSDVIADTIRSLNIPYIALNPGASYRGLHDSLVNRLGNINPQMLLCLHEEHTVAIAQGYAKITEKPMLAAVHSNVGLLHATMAIFDAWCDRVPVIVLGATGPVDAALRRPWIEWIHTARDQGAIVRNFTKWDDQPASPAAAREAVLRAAWLANTAPKGPVYLNFDAAMQESRLEETLPEIDPHRFMPPAPAAVSQEQIARLAAMLQRAKQPLLMMGRVSRNEADWQARIQLAERLGARVLTSLRLAASFPTDHPLHVGAPVARLHPESKRALQEADLIVSFDWLDLAGTLKTGFDHLSPEAKIVQISLDHQLHNGWSMDHQALPPVDLFLATEPDLAIAALLAALGDAPPRPAPPPLAAPAHAPETTPAPAGHVKTAELVRALRRELGARSTCLLHVPVSWRGEDWAFRHPLDFIGGEGGGGIGAGPGIAVGAALALKGGPRIPIAFLGDGDFMMGCSAIWTAAHYRIPLIIIVVNNQSFYHDEAHQQHMAEMRGRAVENRWIGMRMTDPDIDIAKIGAAQGATGLGPVTSVAELSDIFRQAIDAFDAGRTVVIDIRTDTDK
jgi:thiamine pyrophosphate-dependent acetolactate synthase large subunit-like protein